MHPATRRRVNVRAIKPDGIYCKRNESLVTLCGTRTRVLKNRSEIKKRNHNAKFIRRQH